MAFAITGGTFSNPAIWDTGVVPTGNEDCYANGFNITIDGTQSVGTIRNTTSDYYLPNTATAAMTSATSPSGIVTASSQQPSFEGWRAFDRNISTLWATVIGVTTASIVYQFTSTKIIRRYMFRNTSTTGTGARSFTFDGSDDGSSWTTLDTQSTVNVGSLGVFTSGLLANTTAYLYYRINVLTVNGATSLNMTEIEMTESTLSAVGQILAGKFLTGNGSNLTCTANNGIITYFVVNNVPVLECALTSGQSATVNANVTSFNTGVVSGSNALILLSNVGTLNMNGSFVNSNVNTNTASWTFSLQAAGTLNIIGSVSLTAIPTGNPVHYVIRNIGNAVVNITGSVTIAGNNVGTQHAILQNGGQCNITGTVQGGSFVNNNGINATGGGVNIIGDVSSRSAGAAISFSSAGALTVNGVVTALSGASIPAIVSTSTGVVQMSGPFINNAGVPAVQATRMFLNTTSTFWRINTAAGVLRQFSTTDYIGGYPGVPNVRDGVVFGQLGEFTGELIIPPTGSVRKDVPVDNTVGTAELTAADFLAAIDASTSGIGLRLKNVATVQTVGAQVTGFTNN